MDAGAPEQIAFLRALGPVRERRVEGGFVAVGGRPMQRHARACGQLQADYVPLSTKQSHAKALTDYLARRSVR